MEMHTASTVRADLDDGIKLGFGNRRIGFAKGLGRGLHDHLGWCLLNVYAVVAAVLMRRLLVERGRDPQLGALDVPGWLGAVSPDRTPPRAPERGREVVLRAS